MEHAKYGDTVVDPDNIVHDGMSLRDYFASKAPQAPDWWIAAETTAQVAEKVAKWNYTYADAMLKARAA